MFSTLIQTFVLLLTATAALAAPAGRHNWPRFTVPQQHFEVLSMRMQEPVNPAAMVEATCQNSPSAAVSRAPSTPATETPPPPSAQAGSARFSLKTTVEGAQITISKTKWEQCVRAARDKCPTGSLRAVCAGGATVGDVEFTLKNSFGMDDL
ncbi:uncharacterized protein N0V96_002124 [Colletotrichum fioriniae]|uniref:uncharacterized protein n=1 Tax=Colletotrichum fioriniae TaxID=710243 RepID=UPI0032DB16B1|nr:hypothetical protein N0V96_002124 [Colletotrichum fioriniae]